MLEGYQIQNLVESLILGGTIVFLAFSPIARAIASRILHGRLAPPGSAAADAARIDDLSGEMAAMRQAVYEAQERLDFTERMLAQHKIAGGLPPAAER